MKYPYFSIGLIVFGLKIFNPDTLERYFRMAYSIESHIIVGIDIVQEEDLHPEFDIYEPTIRKIQKEFEGKRTLPGVYHAGETKKINSHNVEKVTNFGSVRIGHGLNLFQVQVSIYTACLPASDYQRKEDVHLGLPVEQSIPLLRV